MPKNAESNGHRAEGIRSIVPDQPEPRRVPIAIYGADRGP